MRQFVRYSIFAGATPFYRLGMAEGQYLGTEANVTLGTAHWTNVGEACTVSLGNDDFAPLLL